MEYYLYFGDYVWILFYFGRLTLPSHQARNSMETARALVVGRRYR